ncbi:Mbov_0396 family ICE element transmembrane protein [Spiroplasma sp. AdecLV25b]|uniref:Mbov_0396 family ICE element transmembrane protein n=1 Tax=Spiroplasma sp. AdecLV25b TaxID=3027162 RepID=UPI0027E186B4|nr:hypothetical protein [Spiroplasma sp. AdecLV25b]
MIKNALLGLWWDVFIQGSLYIINAFSKVLNYLTGGVITDLLFGSHQSFSFSNIPMQFWWFVIVAISIWVVFFTIQLLVIQFREETEIKVKFILAFTNGAKGFAFMFIIPIAFFLMNFIIQGFANLIINNFGNNNNIAQYLWHIGDANWDGTANGVPSDFGTPDNIGSYNVIVQTFGTWFMGIGLFMVGLLLTQKVIELFLLFCISPLVMVGMTLDEGKAANTWKDMVIAKFLASTATLIGYFIFISALQAIIHNGTPSLETGDFTKQLFLLLFLCAGALAMLSFADIAAQLVGEAAGIREGFSSFKSTVAGMGMMMGAAKITGKALGMTKSKRALRAMGNSGGALNQAVNSINDSQTNEPLFKSTNFMNATTGMTSRSGIVGLAGLGLGILGATVGAGSAGLRNSYRNKKVSIGQDIDGNKRKVKLHRTKTLAATTLSAPFTFAKHGTKKVGSVAGKSIKHVYDASIGHGVNIHKKVNEESLEKLSKKVNEKSKNSINIEEYNKKKAKLPKAKSSK